MYAGLGILTFIVGLFLILVYMGLSAAWGYMLVSSIFSKTNNQKLKSISKEYSNNDAYCYKLGLKTLPFLLLYVVILLYAIYLISDYVGYLVYTLLDIYFNGK